MAKKNSKLREKKGIVELKVGKSIFIAICFAVFSIFFLISQITFEPTALHSAGSLNEVKEEPVETIPLFGQMGNFVAFYNFSFFGISAWLIPLLLMTISYVYFIGSPKLEKVKKTGSVILIIISISTLANVNFDETTDLQNYIAGFGGYLGAYLYSGLPLNNNSILPSGLLGNLLGPLGTSFICITGIVLSLSLYFSSSISFLKSVLGFLSRKITQEKKTEESVIEKDPVVQKKSKPQKNESKARTILKNIFKSGNSEDDFLFSDVSKNEAPKPEPVSSSNSRKDISSGKEINENDKQADSVSEKLGKGSDLEKEQSINSLDNERKETEKVPLNNDDQSQEVEMDGFKVVRAAKTEKAGDLFPERKGDYHFPSLDLLMEPPEENGNEDEDHMIKARNLKETLAEFKVDIELGEVHTGPVITRYDVHPAAGVRVEKISNLDKNLAMALRADSVRILAPVPGKGCVGIEVPNQNPAAVCLKEILQSKAWADSGAEIPIVLGKEASGKALVADLTKMPHLLVAGSTGSGKTVCINAIIASLCYHSSPEDVRFIMVDPKIVEMKVYNDLPHMLIPVVTEPKKVPGALKWLLVEMERRYQIFSKVGVRNIAGFNAKILKDKEEKEKAQILDSEMTAEERAALSNIEVPRDDSVLEIPENKLPYIVCIIDELADLMMVAQADVETGIARLAQLARAAGIHLIIATQRPSVNVITGVIKANLPSRISFRVASYRDSQTILDGKGAEALIGKGDMLFIPPGSSTFTRAQGAFVSDDEINGIVDYLKINGPPQIIEEVREQIESAGEEDILGDGDSDNDEDPMVRKAIEVIRTTKRASTSNLQRKLSIGYNRAARIMDDLEDRGLVGPDVPGQGREILMDL